MKTWRVQQFRAGVVVAFIASLSGLTGCDDELSSISAPSFIEVMPPSVDFGRSPIGNSIRTELIVKNTGQKTLRIKGVNFTGDTSAFSLQRIPGDIEGNDKKGIILEFRPDEVAEFMAMLTIESDADNNSAVEVMVRGEGVDRTICGDCNDPPENQCITAFDLEVYDFTGECEGGECKYERRVIPCEGRCVDNACVDNKLPLINAALTPMPAYTVDDLAVTATVTDPDGDTVTLTYQWSKDQALQSTQTTSMVSSTETTKGEKWWVTVTADDGRNGVSKFSAWTPILNSKPVIGNVTVTPSSGGENTTFTCTPNNGFDADNDPITLNFQWYVNGQLVMMSFPTINGDYFDAGDEIVCTVTPRDDEEEGLPASSAPIVIGNGAPSIASVVIGPNNPNELSTITASISGWMDEDGDAPQYRYLWWVNSATVSTSPQIDGSLFAHFDQIELDVTPFDGVVEGMTLRSNTLTVQNIPPTTLTATITPGAPSDADDLICSVLAASTDLDPGDTVSYSFAWTNGSMSVSGATVSAALVNAGDVWSCTVTPNDGYDDGPSATVSVGPVGTSCANRSGQDPTCPSIDCATILQAGLSVGDGLYWIDPDGVGPNPAYQVHCLMDSAYDGGGWTLVAVSSDDGQDTWTWNNRNYWDTDTTTFGSLTELHRDFKSPAHHDVRAQDVMFLHAPSGVWAGYDDVSLPNDSFATTIGLISGSGPVCYAHGDGFALSSGTMTLSGSLCSTELFISPLDQDGGGTSACWLQNAAYGPSWSDTFPGGVGSCPFDDPGSSSLGPNQEYPNVEYDSSGSTVRMGIGFGHGLGLNTGTRNTGANNLRVYVRTMVNITWVHSPPAELDFTQSEVTVSQYAACVHAGACSPANYLTNASSVLALGLSTPCNYGERNKGDHPMNCVNYQGANEFCSWVNGRLPSDDEWLAEATNNSTRDYPWGSSPTPSCMDTVMNEAYPNNSGSGCGTQTTNEVCSRPSGNSVSGLCDMAGNVWEWTSLQVSTGARRNRGNCYHDAIQTMPQSFSGPTEDTQHPNQGFRCIRQPAPSCAAILAANPGANDGAYWIDPDGAGGDAPFEVYCDMTEDGGGWTHLLSAESESLYWGNQSANWNGTGNDAAVSSLVSSASDYHGPAYGALPTNEIKLCHRDQSNCHVFNHAQGISLQSFFTSNIAHTVYAIDTDDYPNTGNWSDVTKYISDLQVTYSPWPVRSNPPICYWMGINESVLGSAKIGFVLDANTPCNFSGFGTAPRFNDGGLGVGLWINPADGYTGTAGQARDQNGRVNLTDAWHVLGR